MPDEVTLITSACELARWQKSPFGLLLVDC
jgi:hypothetical protein